MRKDFSFKIDLKSNLDFSNKQKIQINNFIRTPGSFLLKI